MMIETIDSLSRGDLATRWLTPADAAEQVDNFNGVNVAGPGAAPSHGCAPGSASGGKLEQVRTSYSFSPQGDESGCAKLRTSASKMASDLITRENGQRKSVVSLNNQPRGYNMGHLVEGCGQVSPIVQKHGYAVHYGGQFELSGRPHARCTSWAQ